MDGVEGNLVYTRHTSGRGVFHMPNRGQKDTQALVVLSKEVKNARTAQESPQLFTHGFEVFQSPTTLSTQDFYNDYAIKDTNYKEIAELIKSKTGAARVIPFHHQIRASGQQNGNEGRAVGAPAGVIHCDYTTRGALQIFDSLVHSENERKGKFVIINAWRNIAEYPIPNHHLAVCDARSVVAPDDFVVFDLVKPNEKRESYRIDPGHHRLHKWYYYPEMKKDEVLLFVQYDSNPLSPTRYTPHTSFEPSPPPSSALPIRQSLEMRLLALFPSYSPSTIPDRIFSANDRVEKALTGLNLAVRSPGYWPEEAAKWMRITVHSKGIKQVIEQMVTEGAIKGDHGLNNCTKEELEEIKKILLDSKDFKEASERNFPPLPFSSNACESIFLAISYPQSWPLPARTWMKSIIHQIGGGRKAAQVMVSEGAKKGEHGLGGSTPPQQQQVIEQLLANGFEQKARANFPK